MQSKKQMRLLITTLTAILFTSCLYAQEKELLIIGTMHDVPKIVSHSYKPLLKYAKKYRPEAIYVEYNRPDDTLSIKNYTPRFLNLADSLLKSHDIDEHRFQELKAKQLSEMNTSDFSFLAETYLLKKDRANYIFYDYLKNYGTAGPRKPLQEETGDLTIPLAIAMGITELIPIDDHQTEKDYQRAWSNAVKAGKDTGDDIILAQLLKKDRRQRVWPSLWGKLGKYTNKSQTLRRFYLINSCRYVTHPNEYSNAAQQLWDERNYRMAGHLAEQIKTNPYHRNILIIGAGHVISLKEILNQIYPELKVKLMYDK